MPEQKPLKAAVYQMNQGWYYPESVSWVTPLEATNGVTDVLLSVGETPIKTASNVPPQYWNGDAGGGAAQVLSFTTDGTFQAPPPLTRTMEFIGDSITAATNVHARPPCGDAGYQSDYSASYSALLCNDFGANCSTVAVGGKGLIRNCCDQGTRMPHYFLRTTFGSVTNDYTFSQTGFVPQAVVINLGTNDFIGINPTPQFEAEFTAAYIEFMGNITRWYGGGSQPANITFFCAVGPMTNVYLNATLAAVAGSKAAGITAIYLDLMGPPCDGCAGHPGILGHYGMYQLAKPVIAAALGW